MSDKPKTYSEGSMVHVPLGLIVNHDDVKYRALNDEHVDELFNSIKRQGLDTPLTVWNGGSAKGKQMDVDGKGTRPASFLIAGLHRRAALKRLFKEDNARYKELFPDGVPVVVKAGELQDFLALQLRENILRKDMEIEQILPVMKRLKKEFGMKQRDIGKAIGKSEGYVSQIFDAEEQLGEEEVEEIAKSGGKISDLRKGAKAVKEAVKSGKDKTTASKAVSEKIKEKIKSKKASGRKRDDRRVSAKVLLKRYIALPKMSMGDKNIILENALGYLAGDENYELPEELRSDAEEESDEE